MRGFNKVVLMGNLTRDPELRTTPNGQNVCSFSLAVNRSWKNANGEQQEAVDYIDYLEQKYPWLKKDKKEEKKDESTTTMVR